MEELRLPSLFSVSGYKVFFWSNEKGEPIHVHISKGKPSPNATKIWITSRGKCYLAHNNSNIPKATLKNIMRIIEARSDEVIEKWRTYFNQTKFYF